MSLKTLLLPHISRWLFSRQRLLNRRAKAERKRLVRQAPHRVHYFHQVDDPYCALTVAALPRLLARYNIELRVHLVDAPPESAAPEREKLIAFSRDDAEHLARHVGLTFQNPGKQPNAQAIARATAYLVANHEAEAFANTADAITQKLWQGDQDILAGLSGPSASPAAVTAHKTSANALRDRLGHYLGATFYYGGEWYWGIDRLYHLEQRLQELNAQKPGVDGYLFPPTPDLASPITCHQPPPIDFFFSFRSPYSAIVAERVFRLAELTGAKVNLRYVLPMVMRGLPVPRAKREYISHDTAREAFERQIPFGCLNDPVGLPTERGLALIDYAVRIGKGQAYVLSFMRGVWSEGIDAGSDKGLRRIAERAGLNWTEAKLALVQDRWRLQAERNRDDLFRLGLWGVPSFRAGNVVTWGQDRLWRVSEALLKTAAPLRSQA